MPTTLNLTANDRHLAQQSTTLFNKYDVYFVLFAAQELPTHLVWDKLSGSEKWTQNMGPTMRAITPQGSPVTEQEPDPNPITQLSKRNVYSHLESTEDGLIYKQRFESQQIPFVGPFQDVRRDQIDPLLKDVNQKIALYADAHTRHRATQRAEYIYVCGYTGAGDNLVEVPNTKTTADTTPKTTDFWKDLVAKCAGPLKLEDVDRTSLILQDDLGADPFSGPKSGMPLKNDLMKGTYQYVIGREAWNRFKWSENADYLKALDQDFIFKTFQGRLFGRLDCQAERFPLRIAADGTRPAPEIMDSLNRRRPNPAYVNAPFEVGYAIGDNFGKSIEVGPPPKEFAGGKATVSQAKLDWNGKARLTTNVLVKYADGSLDTNDYGEVVQIRSQLAVGYVPGNALALMPILYMRDRVSRA